MFYKGNFPSGYISSIPPDEEEISPPFPSKCGTLTEAYESFSSRPVWGGRSEGLSFPPPKSPISPAGVPDLLTLRLKSSDRRLEPFEALSALFSLAAKTPPLLLLTLYLRIVALVFL